MVSILQRELRIVSRRKWTFFLRVLTTLVGFVFSLFLALFGSPGTGGQYLFQVLLFLSFWFCLIQGVRRAAGLISEEKREGTLGLLFLTSLRPLDIVLGKLFSVVIPLIQPLLAFLPVLSISILLGGTTGGEVIRAALVLGSVLLLSSAAGLFVSASTRSKGRTGLSTIFILLALVFLPLIPLAPIIPFKLLSPWTAFNGVFDPGYRIDPVLFWQSICAINALSLIMLVGAWFYLPRRWQDEPLIAKKRAIFRRNFSPQQRAQILDRNPGEWIAIRTSLGRFETLAFNAAMLLLTAVAIIIAAIDIGAFHWIPISVASFILQLWLASAASYPMIDARRSGGIEIILSTPLHPSRLVTGQCRALLHQFVPPLSILLLAAIGGSVYQISAHGRWETIVMIAVFAFGLIATSVSVASVGIWMGLREKTPNAAFFKTLLFGLILPGMFSGCLPLPFSYVLVPVIAATQITGGELRRLLANEKRSLAWRVRAETVPTPVGPPPVIKPPLIPRG